ncbi:DUF1800 domain-containing protein [Tistrella bauzanensis]|uniref:DUF1800 domain-containing protein n=1 Tax=Tistrella arctica TaxID=3133430 RepID=A0ABU9YD83_9PROT
MPREDTITAMTRFGCGVTPDQTDAVDADPRGWLDRQLVSVNSTPASFAGLPPFIERIDLFSSKRGPDNKTDDELEARRVLRWQFNEKIAQARISAAIDSSFPLQERLVHFWFSHFTISTLVGGVVGVADIYENRSIRPHILGRFRTMLGAVVSDPMMLTYLDNTVSVGPNSVTGKTSSKGLNENLARELLELHTLGVEGGYTQRDVISLAKILTGWSTTSVTADDAMEFRFVAGWHEPGDKELLGRKIVESGEDEVRAALDILAASPKTARHIARKLVTHFVSDIPPDDLVNALEQRFIDTDGDLRAVTQALIEHPGSWVPQRTKALPPEDWAVALARLIGVDGETAAPGLQVAITQLGQKIYGARSPQGWPEAASAWLTPETVIARAAWGRKIASDLPADTDVRVLIALWGMNENEEAGRAIAGAPSQADAIALLAASPQFSFR